MVKKATGTINLSKKHGVNPMLCLCFFCHEETGEIAMLGRLKNDEQAPRSGVLNRTPCAKCKEHMEQGVMLVAVRDGETGENPYRTGGIAVVTENGIRGMIEDEQLREHVLKTRFCYVPDATWVALGLPTGGETVDNRNKTEEHCGHDHGHDRAQ